MIEFILNGKPVSTDDDPTTPLLWVVRDTFKLKGSKFGCGAGLCGACTMHIDDEAMRTCMLPISAVAGRQVTTIEGLGTMDDMHPLQTAWVNASVPQCGYCQSGQIMAAASLLTSNPNPTEADIDAAMSGNICRCGCYVRIKSTILSVAQQNLAYNAAQEQKA
ncbi:(2Fe-2S)-binding protein [Pseudomonadales bacterium]|nr:(2Fe-2S)-binding protein [Pseudomonadales bacterium]MDB9879058.1 (2Fe-2S)-binding protein [Pseudomonadales bacterium]MDB9916754.1 (2Fe-2S)-binding protein [Pseudomonadales bacterium]MDC1307812.1 (2Fe-2S)-binding protein [Pseudomonadales bacterium]|tara:strand:+ start:274 stop:762 length:489 start_codon:yes stop_codon:yes gene_type:complete